MNHPRISRSRALLFVWAQLSLWSGPFLVGVAAATAETDNDGDYPDEILKFNKCHLGSEERCPYSTIFESQNSTLIFPPSSEAACFSDTRTDGKRNDYFFQVDPGLKGRNQNIVLVFTGGGLCFSTETCLADAGIVLRDAQPAVKTGLLNTEDPNGLLYGWTKIFINYCSGDAYIGNQITPDGITKFWGSRNTRVVLDWVFENFGSWTPPDRTFPTDRTTYQIDRFVASGTSAGSIGLQFWANIISQWLSEGFDWKWKPTATFLLDSQVGAIKKYTTDRVLEIWNPCQPSTGYPEDLLEDCKRGEFLTMEANLYNQGNNRDIPFAFITPKTDLTQQIFWCVSGLDDFDVGLSEVAGQEIGLDEILYGLEFLSQSSGSQLLDTILCTPGLHYAAMEDMIRTYQQAVSKDENNNVLTYFINSWDHVVTTNKDFDEVTSDGGKSGILRGLFHNKPPLKDWIKYLIFRQPGEVIESVCTPGVGLWPLEDYCCDSEMANKHFVAQ